MKILVFGGQNGQVATCLSNLSDFENNVRRMGRDEVDFATPGQIAKAVLATDADVIINAAAYTAVDQAEKEPLLADQINHQAVAELGKAAALRSIPVLHISTDYVFSGSSSTPSLPSDPPAPLGVYGATKLRGEQALANVGGTFAVLRTSWVFSAHGNNFVKSMLKSEGDVRIVNDQVGGPTNAMDIAQCLLVMARAFRTGEARSGIYHISGTPDCTWAEFAQAIFSTAQRRVGVIPIPSKDYPTLAPRPKNSRLDCRSIASDFGITRPEWSAGLTHVIQELRTNG